LVQAGLFKLGFSRIISVPIGSQIITIAFSVHTSCTRKPECTRATFTQSHSDPTKANFLLEAFVPPFTSQRAHSDETPRTIHIQPEQKSALAMKSKSIKRPEGEIMRAATLA
jgi:hypothetical protein